MPRIIMVLSFIIAANFWGVYAFQRVSELATIALTIASVATLLFVLVALRNALLANLKFPWKPDSDENGNPIYNERHRLIENNIKMSIFAILGFFALLIEPILGLVLTGISVYLLSFVNLSIYFGERKLRWAGPQSRSTLKQKARSQVNRQLIRRALIFILALILAMVFALVYGTVELGLRYIAILFACAMFAWAITYAILLRGNR